MKTTLSFFLLFTALFSVLCFGQIEYGSNGSAGSYARVNGVNLYYEIYGSGDPILMIHGNGADISSMRFQIEHFKNDYQVIAVDSRGHGKSDLGEGQLTYRQIARDMASLLVNLSIDKVHVVGWSDGGVIGLILGVEYPQLISKMVLMAPNTRPGTEALDATVIDAYEAGLNQIEEMIAAGDTSEDWERAKQRTMMPLTQPNISQDELRRIEAPILLVAGDRDLIRNTHTVEIFESLTNAHLAILPNETHFTPVTNPQLFNSLAENFIESEFERSESMEVYSQIEL